MIRQIIIAVEVVIAQNIVPLNHWLLENAVIPSENHQLGNSGFDARLKPGRRMDRFMSPSVVR